MQVTDITGVVSPQKTNYWNLKEKPIDKQRFHYFKGTFYSWAEDTRAESDTPVS